MPIKDGVVLSGSQFEIEEPVPAQVLTMANIYFLHYKYMTAGLAIHIFMGTEIRVLSLTG